MSCAEIESAREVKLMELRTASDIEIELLVPNENFVPPGVLRRAGNFVMQRVVDIGLPQVCPSINAVAWRTLRVLVPTWGAQHVGCVNSVHSSLECTF